MKKEILIKKIDSYIAEADEKIEELKHKITNKNSEGLNEKVRLSVVQLQEIKAFILKLKRNAEFSEQNDQPEIDAIEKNIYSSYQSFNNAFTKAGGIFTTK